MRLRDSIGLNLAPVFLRLVLGIIFLWAGAGKFFATDPFTPEQTARLAQMGVDIPGQPPAQLPVVPDEPADETGEPDETDETGEAAATDAAAEVQPIDAPDPDQFPEGAELRRVYGLALAIDGAAHPGFNKDGEQLDPIWPPSAATGKWPVYIALAAGITELVAGILILAGFFTRIAAFSVACVMAAAMWLTQFGPAIQSGDTQLGFLPTHPLYDGAWQTLMIQFSLFGAALALLFLGAGAMSIDAIIFGAPGERRRRPPREDDDD